MRNQASFEYLLLLGGVVVIVLVLGSGLVSTASFLYNTVREEVNVPLPVPSPPADTVPPTVDLQPATYIASPAEKVTFTCYASDSGSGISSIQVTYSLVSKECNSSPCSLTVFAPLTEGSWTITCTAYDNSGNSSSDTSTLYVQGASFPPPGPIPPPGKGTPIVPI